MGRCSSSTNLIVPLPYDSTQVPRRPAKVGICSEGVPGATVPEVHEWAVWTASTNVYHGDQESSWVLKRPLDNNLRHPGNSNKEGNWVGNGGRGSRPFRRNERTLNVLYRSVHTRRKYVSGSISDSRGPAVTNSGEAQL